MITKQIENVNMSQTNQLTIDTYNKTVSKYFDTSPQTITVGLQPWIDQNLAQLTPAAKILEIGSGTGKDSKYMESKGFKVELTDASQGFVDYLNSNGRPARLLNALTDDLGSNYDMIFANAVLVHFTRQETKAFLPKVYRALKPGGRFVFSLKTGEGEGLSNYKLEAQRYFCYWQQAAIEKLLAAQKFININTIVDTTRGQKKTFLLISAEKTQ